MKFKTISNYEPFQGRKFHEESLTVPDSSMSLRAIIDSYSRGVIPHGLSSEDSSTGLFGEYDDDSTDGLIDPVNDVIDDPLTYQQELKDKINEYRRELYRYSKSSISRSGESEVTKRSEVHEDSQRQIDVENNET